MLGSCLLRTVFSVMISRILRVLSAVSICALANCVKANSKTANNQMPTPSKIEGIVVPARNSLTATRLRMMTESQVIMSKMRRLILAERYRVCIPCP